jgi:hypothetical protein
MAVASAHADGVPASRNDVVFSCLEDAVVNPDISTISDMKMEKDFGS